MRIPLILVLAGALSACGNDDTATPSTAETEPMKKDMAPAQAERPAMSIAEQRTFDYPDTAKADQVDDYHGTQVADPYRWLEEDVREAEDVERWVAAQNDVTFDYLKSIPERDEIETRLTTLWNYEKFDIPFKQGGKYFFFKNDGLQNQSVLYVQDTLDAEPKLVIDPNTWSDDGTVALADVEVSPDGKIAAYAVQDGGSDWRTIEFLNLETGEKLTDKVEWMKFSDIEWAPDSSGVYYSRYPEPEEGAEFQSLNHNQAVYFHSVGTNQDNDTLVYTRPDHPDWGYGASVTDDGQYLVIIVWKGTDDRYQVAYKDLSHADSEVTMLIEGFDNDYTPIGSDGTRLLFRTDNNAPKGRIVAIDVTEPDRLIEIVGETDNVLYFADIVGEQLVAEYLKDARSQVIVYGLDGEQVREVALPGIGSVGGFAGDAGDPETFYSFSSFNMPPTIYRYDVASGESSEFKTVSVDFDPSDYVVKQVFYTSKDGTRVPMFISHREGVELDGTNPTLLYGYGGFNVSLTPSFSITRLAWMEMGGVYAVANLRGGGEYGEPWHKAGTKLNKQNVFDDFIAAGEYLVSERYTNAEKLAVMGGSNGGLLVGAVVNQRPDLFGAALPAVGVMDMLRFHQFTAGRFWVDDYGSAENAKEFEALYAYSPYHNVQDGAEYPAVLVTTADTDDRVVPGHSFKYAARLQEAQSGSDPVLIRIETRAGHGAGKPTEKIIEEYADMWAFLADNLEMTLPEGYGQ